MQKFVIGSAVLLALSACSGGMMSGGTSSTGNEAQVCGEQSDWAHSGKVGGGNVTITCPEGTRPANGTAVPAHHNEYNRNAEIYRAGWDGFMKVYTAK
ncbi:hypothetical protein EOK75_09420 [Pseudorhodobacter turbinis]|uniref:Lipoprotein n=1 Tax=Pseudorhodobacter turbinis TaxID=2500533 RepID=A0A4P8EGB6_9RHOB|nr:hypothetical protein [Pseudorhodobacter turbinis]QCO55936.1 hypothetical protein EOK75_09420 [Pseudorhodobacter turbinis]